MPPSVRRLAVTVLAAAAIAACAVPPAVPDPRAAPNDAPPPDPTQPYGPYPTLPATAGQPPVGNTAEQYPSLSVGLDGGYVVELVDPTARAWWIVVSGTGPRSADRIEIVAEAGDVWPGAIVRLYVDGALTDTTDLNGLLGNTTAVAGGCHPTLRLCYSSAGVRIEPAEGRLTLVLDGAATGIEVRGAVASYEGEPFVLGPWRGTDVIAIG